MKDYKMLKTTLIFSVMMFIMACSEVKQVESPEQLINRVNEIYTEVAKAYPNEGELPPTNRLDSLYCSSEWNRMLAVIDSIDSKLEGEMGFFDFDYFGMDYYWVNTCTNEKPLRYSDFNMGDEVRMNVDAQKERADWIGTDKERLNKRTTIDRC